MVEPWIVIEATAGTLGNVRGSLPGEGLGDLPYSTTAHAYGLCNLGDCQAGTPQLHYPHNNFCWERSWQTIPLWR